MSDLIPYSEIEKMGKAIALSKLFGLATPEQAIALMLVAQAEGRHPASAARDYNIILNRPALKADAVLGRFQEAGGKVEWQEYTDEKVTAKFSHAQGGTVEISWDMDRAKQAGIGGKDNWKKYPRQMLRARVISEGVRTTYPAVLCGFYTPEEVQDFIPDKKDVIDIPQNAGQDVPSPPVPQSSPLSVADIMDKIKEAKALPHLKNIWTKHYEEIKSFHESDQEMLEEWKDRKKEELIGKSEG